MFKKVLFYSFFLIISGFFIFSQLQALAQDNPTIKNAGTELGKLAPAYGGEPKQLEAVVGGIIEAALVLLGVIFLILMIYGGFKWMLARGESKEVDEAQDIIKRSIVGLIIVVAAYAITYFVVFYLTGASGIEFGGGGTTPE
ncbi:MAG: hypothetical protein UT86_C0004G0088 [Candidatus Magasanikbacteria bacterium GW2011_GWC2_40_17]|nr:MAG: hypothetical protein UT86_C0004G0088 [Candidatus Magasanikbacteria bacterium GW2011_GWC2_40_17]